MIIYNGIDIKTDNMSVTKSKEDLLKRKTQLDIFNREVSKQALINEKRRIKSLEYASTKYLNM